MTVTRKQRLAVLAAGAISAVALAACHGSTTAAASPPAPSTSAPFTPINENVGPTTPPPAPPTTAPPAAPTTPAPPASPAMTASQQQAVEAAQSYLSDGSGFSQSGLIQQLTSQSGNGFSTADATFAVNYLNPNWNAQAVDAAGSYLSEGSGFSQSGLIQQLTSQSGNGFSTAQATYAVNSLNPNWDAQAAIAAKGYVSDGSGFSRSSLIQQLTSQYGNGFTEAQAEYGASAAGL
jgi:hypothetical protein